MALIDLGNLRCLSWERTRYVSKSSPSMQRIVTRQSIYRVQMRAEVLNMRICVNAARWEL